MFKLLAIFVLIWIFFKALGIIIKTVLGPDSNRHTRYTNQGKSKGQGDIHVDHNPNRSNKGYDGGEYVDYEEVE
jgi:hypothetical protein